MKNEKKNDPYMTFISAGLAVCMILLGAAGCLLGTRGRGFITGAAGISAALPIVAMQIPARRRTLLLGMLGGLILSVIGAFALKKADGLPTVLLAAVLLAAVCFVVDGIVQRNAQKESK